MISSCLRQLCLVAAVAAPICAQAAAPEDDDPWPGLVQDIFQGRPMEDGSRLIVLEAPNRAEDAAVVPVTLRTTLPPGDARYPMSMTLVIDHNPAPMAARFEFGRDSTITALSTRVRVNAYTDVHAVLELSDGKLYVTKKYVKASGGCSAPAAKDAEAAKKRLGQLRFRQFATPPDPQASRTREAQLIIGHPNNSGLQMDQLTHLYIPPSFVNEVRIWRNDEMMLSMEGGISISEDPNIRFTYVAGDEDRIRVEAKDTDGRVFKGEWPSEQPGP
ncbi:quinoprotein dehydrogenase-associated SoxYZ-like carrier [Alsobacter soli]|uniref:Quinoprotein dehydrogenase-associated SoxYZ-like carrier n=1 Tax=Alsobacter soli TaxID=2109933 RepID=A0A2T1HUJ4_9HYPH|nr:quinoprotein dehydrogenase-associated SoxYZ-like carrier [Alsobacter soli]